MRARVWTTDKFMELGCRDMRTAGIIRMKNPVDYDPRLLRKRDAQKVAKDAGIFLEWVEGRITAP